MKKLTEYVGVASPWDLLSTSLKREILFFDVIAVPNILTLIAENNPLTVCPIKALQYLVEKEIVIDPVYRYIGLETYHRKIGKDVYDHRLRELELRKNQLSYELAKSPSPEIKNRLQEVLEFFLLNWDERLAKVPKLLERDIIIPFQKFGEMASLAIRSWDYDRRGISCDLRQRFGINSYPIYSTPVTINDELVDGKDDLIQIVIQNLPEPDFESVSWEQILDFRNDPRTKSKLMALRNWCNEITKGNLTGFEVAEKIDFLCNEYEEHIKLNKMKANMGFFETLLVVPAQTIEGLIRLKPTKSVKAIFAFKLRKAKLREAELKAPGREVAYIIEARKRFPARNID